MIIKEGRKSEYPQNTMGDKIRNVPYSQTQKFKQRLRCAIAERHLAWVGGMLILLLVIAMSIVSDHSVQSELFSLFCWSCVHICINLYHCNVCS